MFKRDLALLAILAVFWFGGTALIAPAALEGAAMLYAAFALGAVSARLTQG